MCSPQCAWPGSGEGTTLRRVQEHVQTSTTNMETPYLGSHRIGRWLRSTSWSKCWLGGLGGGARYLPCRCQWISAV
ncbi:hypothetical protein BRADI_3g19931v3 [Brachypodium distachyon]|uniref:Uncharacterized protein n=1 Tax=Brachypodium distachyon TaxID=15368 RepID=A0A2K2CYE8_BRADI|nr:hypothetical protein BRADI_3g19931v3 [Brachypodium distachyon]